MADAEQLKMIRRRYIKASDASIVIQVFTLVRIGVLAAWAIALVDKKQEYTKREGTLASLWHDTNAERSCVITGCQGGARSALSSMPEMCRS